MQQTLFEATDTPAVIVYTDGGCDPNPGPGGWAAILCYSDHEVVLSGNALHSTNNRMEIEAAIAALAYLAGRHGPSKVDLHTDSRYLRHGITGWIDDWFARGWKTRAGQPVKNQDIWRRLYDLTRAHEIAWYWVKGHAGEPLNERVDQLAQAARERVKETGSASASNEAEPVDTARPSIELWIGVSCLDSNGPGAWAVVMREGEARTVLHGQQREATSNALYLEAALQGLRAVRDRCPVTVFAASDYLIRGASEWAPRWQRSGWRTKGGSEVQNRGAWEALLKAAEPHQVSWQLAQGSDQDDEVSQAKRIAGREAARLA